MTAAEFNFDGLVGPTHNYAGLAHGNLASQQNRHLVSHPKLAALQGLDKMKILADRGVPQIVLPPQVRPDLAALRRVGFAGSDADILARAAREAPALLAACASSSSMWAANAATVAPSADTSDGRMHITAANLASHFHRSLEAPTTREVLRTILPGPLFVHHEPLPTTPSFFDEGAANHTRLCRDHGDAGIHLFTYGHDPDVPRQAAHVSPRHSRTASEAIVRLHGLDPERTFFVCQHPEAIDAGVFHNDVIAVGHRHVLLHHERAWSDAPALMDALRAAFSRVNGGAELLPICIPDSLLPLADAVRSYLFNSQIVSLPDDTMLLLAPTDCQGVPSAMAALDFIRRQIPSLAVEFVDIRQSMLNGGGPACLRLRVVLTPPEQAALHAGVRLTDALYLQLRAFIERHYREDLHPAELADPALLAESRAAVDDIRTLLQLPRDPALP